MAERRTDNEDVCAAYIVEFEQLRGEIDNRTQIASALIAVDLTALGLGLASIASYPDAALGIAVASTFLWMLWIDQAAQIWKIAAYIAIELAPQLGESYPGAFGWETFLRQLDKGGNDARRALRIDDTDCVIPSLKTATVGLYGALLFGAAPLVLLGFSVGAMFEGMSGNARIAKAAALFGSLLLWSGGLYVYRRFRSFRSVIDLAIERSVFAASTPVVGHQQEVLLDASRDQRLTSP